MKKMRVIMKGQGRNEDFVAVSHELMGLPGGTYHVFKMPDGRTVYYNDFGIQIVEIMPL